MFGRHYFGGRFFGGRYFGDGGDIPAAGASAAQVWAYVLPNGRTAGQNLVDIADGITALLALPSCLETPVEGGFTGADILRLLAAVAAGKTTITAGGGGAAQVAFRALDDSRTVVDASMQGSERIDVIIDTGDTPS